MKNIKFTKKGEESYEKEKKKERKEKWLYKEKGRKRYTLDRKSKGQKGKKKSYKESSK